MESIAFESTVRALENMVDLVKVDGSDEDIAEAQRYLDNYRLVAANAEVLVTTEDRAGSW